MPDPEQERLRAAIAATRSVLKSHQRSCRTALRYLADLDEQLDAAAERRAEGGTANDRPADHTDAR